MTSLITDVLHERADRAGSPDLDLDRLVAEGEARARRTRVTRVAGATGVGLLAAATVAAVVLTGTTDGPTTSSEGPATSGGTTAPLSRSLSYAHDGTFVLPQRDLELDAGGQVASYVPTDEGFVWADRAGTISFLPASGGPSVEIGSTDPQGGALRAEKDGSLAAWIDFSVPAGPELVVHDTATGAEVMRTGEDLDADADAYRDSPNPAYVYAVDRGSVYWRNGAGAVRTEVATGRSEVLDPDADGFTIADVADGQIASDPGSVSPSGDVAEQDRTRVGPSLAQGTDLPWSGNVHLSPDAGYVSFEDEDELVVAEVATGREVAPDLAPGTPSAYAVAFQWTSEVTYAVFSIRSVDDLDNPSPGTRTTLDFLECNVVTQTCETVASPSVILDDGFQLQLPVGESG